METGASFDKKPVVQRRHRPQNFLLL